MKFQVRLLALATLVALLAIAAVAAPQAGQKGPQIAFEKKLHDFGEVRPNMDVPCEFWFRNVGTGELIIQNVRASCGCTAVMPEKTKLAPGERSRINVSFKTGRAPGPQKKQITVSSNDPDNGNATLEIMANVISDLDLSSTYLKFENVERDKPAESSIQLLAKNPKSLAVKELTADNPAFVPKIERTSDGRILLVVHYLPQKAGQSQSEFLNGAVHAKTNSQAYPDLTVPIYLRFLADFVAVPQRIVAYEVERGKPMMREIVIKSAKSAPFQITGTTSTSEDIRAEVVDNGKAANTVRIIVDDRKKLGYANGIVTVEAKDKKIQIPVRINFKAAQ